MKNLEKRMYFFVIRQLDGLNAGIQCGHAADYQFDNNGKWLELIGGEKNLFLRELLKGKKTA